jgi:hypothetical protein
VIQSKFSDTAFTKPVPQRNNKKFITRKKSLCTPVPPTPRYHTHHFHLKTLKLQPPPRNFNRRKIHVPLRDTVDQRLLIRLAHGAVLGNLTSLEVLDQMSQRAR